MDLRAKRGKWEYRFRFEGTRVTKVTGLEATEPNRKKAEKLAIQHRDELLKGIQEARKPKHRLFTEACSEFESFLGVEHQDKPNTVKRVLTSLASLKLFFARHRISGITVAEVEKYKVMRLGEHKVKPITLRHDLDNLSKFFRWAIRMRYATANPVSEVSKPSDADAMRIHVLTREEEFLYFEAARTHRSLFDVARLILNQGMRPDEVMTLQKSDLDIEKRRINIRQGKTKAARRSLRLTQESFEILKNRLEGDSPWFFPSPKKPGEPLSKLNGVHDRVCEKANVLFVLYDLRHTFATRAAAAGMPVPALAAILGHSSLRMIMKYVHPTQEHLDEQMQHVERIGQQVRPHHLGSTSKDSIQPN